MSLSDGVNFNFKYPFVYLLLALIAGILCSGWLYLPLSVFYGSGLLSLFILKRYPRLSELFIFVCVFATGLQTATPPAFRPERNSLYLVRARCEEILSRNNYILSMEGQRFYLSSYHTDSSYRLGDSLTFYSRIHLLTDRSNPGEFSYTRYLKQKNVRHQLTPRTGITLSGHSDNIRSLFQDYRRYFLRKTARLFPNSDSRTLIEALCLGYKNDLDSGVKTLFADTGTVHLLSVSGLHTGAIYLLLIWIFRITGLKEGKKELLLLPVLWAYACLTGLSPSVVRAATILSFITLGRVLNRNYTSLNSLAASAFFTLSVDPFMLYSLSFLMSYSAYGGILLLYPVFNRLKGKLSPLLSFLYQSCNLTLSAQYFTLPITAYFFHTVNLTGILANLPAVPLATLLLYCSALTLLLPVSLGQYTAWVCEGLSRVLLLFLKTVAPFSMNIREVYPSALLLLSIYGCLFAFALYLGQRKKAWLRWTALSFFSLLLCLVAHQSYLSTRQEVVVFHYPRESVVLLNHRGRFLPLKNTSPGQRTPAYIRQNNLRPYPAASGILSPGFDWCPPCLSVDGTLILVADSVHRNYRPCHTLVVTDNLSPHQLLSSASSFPQKIITDGSVDYERQRQWKLFCQKHHIPLHSTVEQGCIRLSLK